MPERSDQELIREFQGGNKEAFEKIYYRYRDWVVGLAYRFCEDRDDSLDVLQETFSYFFRKLPDFELRANFKTFLYPVVKHLALNIKTKRRKQVSIDIVEDPAVQDAKPDDSNSLLACLPEDQREIVRMRFVDEMPLADIAETLKIPLGTVKSRLHTALKTLRDRGGVN